MANIGKPKPQGIHKIKAFDSHSDPLAIALKRLHDDVESEAIPAEFMDLLAAIDRKMETKAKGE